MFIRDTRVSKTKAMKINMHVDVNDASEQINTIGCKLMQEVSSWCKWMQIDNDGYKLIQIEINGCKLMQVDVF